MDEFALIRRYFDRSLQDDSVLLGIGDDAAIIAPEHGHDLVCAVDTIVAGTHYPDDLPPFDVGYHRTARLADAGENIVNEGIACKVFASEAVGEIVDTSIQLVGGVALIEGHPLELLYRKVRSLRLAEGGSDVLRLNLARGKLELNKGTI